MPRIAVTLGDPRGVGPEVAAVATRQFLAEHPDDPVLLLGARALDPGLCEYQDVGDWDGSEAGAGSVAGGAVTAAVRHALAGTVRAVVTAPIHKPALAAAGIAARGHTELLRDLTRAPAVGMLMAAEQTRLGCPLRVLLATTHHPLRAVPRLVTTELLIQQTELLAEGLRLDWRISEPKVALCALNPHASDTGLFGDEEAQVYAPALAHLRARGVAVTGPFPADTVFRRALAGEADAVLAPYHDVGMAAFKTVAFGSGVNVTLGLPFIRTSPDHGTAFDIAGTGRADASSMLAALRLARRLAANRFDSPKGGG